MWNHRRIDPVEAQADELALECELLLSGRYAPFVRAQRRTVPAWAWAGVLAHATAHDLKAWATVDVEGGAARRDDEQEWRRTIAFLAQDILNHSRTTGVSLRELQQTTLVPIELRLMKDDDGPAMGPTQLAGLVLASVHRHPSRPR